MVGRMAWTVSIDGGARGNPGPAAAGVQICDDSGDAVLAAGFFLGHLTNNQAEYHGLLKALQLLTRTQARNVEIIADSQLMVRQINGQYRVKAPGLKPLFDQARTLLEGFDRWRISHVRREANTQADALANLAMDARADVTETDTLGLLGSKSPAEATTRPGRATRAAPGGPPTGITPPSVKVVVVEPPDPAVCPAALRRSQSFLFTAVTPANLCLKICPTLIEAVRVLQSTETPDVAPTAPVEVRCPETGCGARFVLHPA